ncbi:MAG: DEAD/DEAH box helicase family protein [Alphaproteobacteria bacterium]|nr:DEAD/DEAH box helicase family protein [Alphaproteobacteria bacterium]
MPRIFDNIDLKLETALKESLELSYRADFCVGFFNLRGWHTISDYIDVFEGGEGKNCRLLIGMQRTPKELLNELYTVNAENSFMDMAQAQKLKKMIVNEFKEQLIIGIPDKNQEKALKSLLRQLKSKKLIVKFYLKDLHAKLYLAYRNDKINPIIPYLGSSNLTFAGLSKQGELNVDVLDSDAAIKLSNWFEDRWNENWCIDITEDLIKIIENSWCREDNLPPYYIYLKMAYHMAQEAREGLTEFRIPKVFKNQLLDFQIKSCLIAARYLNIRNGVLIGDVVGLGKTITACAVAKIFENDLDISCLIICPANLIPMWEKYREKYDLRAKIISSAVVQDQLPELKRYRLVIIDESHNLRNKESKRYNAIRDYIQRNESKVILLTATPYNKSFQDISTQLRFFITDDEELPVRPERMLSEQPEAQFVSDSQIQPRSILAFEKSEYAEDWQDLLRYYMIRRTRSFIKDNYAKLDPINNRKYLEFFDGTKSYFPERIAKSIKFKVDSKNPLDQYAALYSKEIVDIINSLEIPRYGLAGKLIDKKELEKIKLTVEEDKIIKNLSRAGKEIIGFCRTNLFKRLESSGYSFILSLKRHILRNNIFLYAYNNNLPLPIGSQSFEFIDDDSNITDSDQENLINLDNELLENTPLSTNLYKKASEAYKIYIEKYKSRFKWINSSFFKKTLKTDLEKDNRALEGIIEKIGEWKSNDDEKLKSLINLVSKKHKDDKILIFTQYADTANYLNEQLKAKNIKHVECATGGSCDPTLLASRFSPISNEYSITDGNETRILIATDVLSEGQNLQDAHIIVNFDLPWAIIKLIQRAGRVDRIGQKSEEILCYNFLPADGVEQILTLRGRLKKRLKDNAEVVGTDERFFDDEDKVKLRDLYNEKSQVLDDEETSDIDLSSYAYQIWQNAIEQNKELQTIIPQLPDIVYSTKYSNNRKGVIVYTQTAYGNDILSFVGTDGLTQPLSQFTLLKMAECEACEVSIDNLDNHFDLVKSGVENIIKNEKLIGGQLGKKSSARYRTYQRLNSYAQEQKGTLFDTTDLHRAIDDIYKYPLTEKSKEKLNRQLKAGIDDISLFRLVNELRNDGTLCLTTEEISHKPPRIICSMGMHNGE